jgi:carbamoyl-phosphate synthase small subunit
MKNQESAVLLLDDGTVVHGQSFGIRGIATGELCFTTGMTGYQEVFTDPSFYGQVLIMTAAHIGNYGVLPEETESNHVKVKAVVAKNLESMFSRHKSVQSLQDYFVQENIVAIHNVDTRALVTHIRKKGAMNCIVSTDQTPVEKLQTMLKDVPSMQGMELASLVSTREVYTFGDPNAKIKVAVLDFGIKRNILQCLADRGAFLKVYPAKTSFETMEKDNPDGYFISNGPGDPQPMQYAVETVRKILEVNKPLFGICLGHQLLALANGIPTFKMHHGHRGLNHPVKNVITGLSEITTQNHGFGIAPEAVTNNPNIEITHVNLNDNSVEGIRMKNKKAFSVQYHPEATPGPHDSRYLFDAFIELMQS